MGRPGILWVASRITNPSKLSDSTFCTWYEDTHVDEVVSLSGVTAAARYEAVPMSEVAGPATPESIKASAKEPAPSYLMGAKWLTIYEMRDVEFRKTNEFRGLDGQSRPREELLNTVFKNAKFETRFGELISIDEKSGGAQKGPARLIVSATMTANSKASANEIERFYEEEHVREVAKCPGYIRTRRYRWVDSSNLDEFERQTAEPIENGVSVVALHEFDAEYFPMVDMLKADETEWTGKVLGGCLKAGGLEAGFYRLKRVYGEFKDRGPKL